MTAAAAKETDEADTEATAAADLSANAGAEVATTQAVHVHPSAFLSCCAPFSLFVKLAFQSLVIFL